MELHQIGVQILHILELPPPVLAQGHDVAHVLVRGEDGDLHKGLLGLRDDAGVRVVVGVVHVHHRAVGLGDLVDNGGQGGDEVQIKLPLQPLLNNLRVEHPQKAAPEPEAQGHGALRLKGQGGVVELQLLQRVPQVGVLAAVLRIHAAVDHGLGLPVTRQGLSGGVLLSGDGVAHLRVPHVLDGGGEVAHLPRPQLLAALVPQGPQQPALQHLVLRPAGHHPDWHSLFQRPVHDPEVDDNPLVGVVVAVKDEGPQGGVGVSGGGGHMLHHVLQHGGDVKPHLRGDLRRVQCRDPDNILDLMLDPLRVGGGQIDFVDHRPDLQIVVQGQIGIGQRLRLDALTGVHHQHRPLAGGQRPADLVVEVHMSRRIDKVERVRLPILGGVVEGNGPGLNGDASLPLQVHIIQQLVFHIPLRHRAAGLQQPVGQRGFSMVNMGNNRKISNFLLVHPCTSFLRALRARGVNYSVR